MSAAVLEGRRLRHSYGSMRVLDGLDIEVGTGEVVAVMGPSGSGKSTLLHLLAGLLVPDEGEVWLAGEQVDRLPERRRSELRLRQFGFVFQFGDLVPELTVVENVELPLRLTGVRSSPARTRAIAMLDRLGVADQADKRLSEVSGGQAQRAAVARALVHTPPLVLADEPTGSLDTVTGELVLEALVGTATEQGTAVLLVTHERRVDAVAVGGVEVQRRVAAWAEGRGYVASPYPRTDYDGIQGWRTAALTLCGVVVGVGLLVLALTAADRARERCRPVARLVAIGVPPRVLRVGQVVQTLVPTVVTAALALGSGVVALAAYLTEATAATEARATTLIDARSWVVLLAAVSAGMLLVGLATVPLIRTRMTPDLLRQE